MAVLFLDKTIIFNWRVSQPADFLRRTINNDIAAGAMPGSSLKGKIWPFIVIPSYFKRYLKKYMIYDQNSCVL